MREHRACVAHGIRPEDDRVRRERRVGGVQEERAAARLGDAAVAPNALIVFRIITRRTAPGTASG